jgi:hypothetical protein
MPQVGFEPMIPVFGRAKTVHALDRAATVIGSRQKYIYTKYVYHTSHTRATYSPHIILLEISE